MAKYFTSDWHLNEKRISLKGNIGGFNPFFRPFKSVEEQNQTIIDNVNNIVQPGDELYVLGDVVIDKAGIQLLDQIKCRDRILIVGNYDEDKLEQLQGYFKEIKGSMDLKINDLECHLNHYPVNHVSDKFNIVGHVHGLWKVKPNMVNVGVDAWHFRPVSEEEIQFIYDAIKNRYDENVFIHCK